MPTKYGRQAQEEWKRRDLGRVWREDAVPSRYRARLTLIMLASAAMVLVLHNLRPITEKVTGERRLGTAVVEAVEKQGVPGADESGLRLRMIAPTAGTKVVFARVEAEFMDRYSVGDRVAVVYVPAKGFAPLRIVEVGVAPLSEAAVPPGTEVGSPAPEAETMDER